MKHTATTFVVVALGAALVPIGDGCGVCGQIFSDWFCQYVLACGSVLARVVTALLGG